MAKFVFPMQQSLDGYVGGAGGEMTLPGPDSASFRHFTDLVAGLTGGVFGRKIYELLTYWDKDQPDWDAGDREFAAVWRRLPKWVVSRTLKSVGPNATLVQGDLETAMRELKQRYDGDIEVAGPELAGALTRLGLIDEYRLYFRPIVLGAGKPYFAGPTPPLRLVGHERVGDDTIMLRYVPA